VTEETAPAETDPGAARPATLVLCAALAVLEAVAVLAYTIGILVSGAQNPTSVAAPFVEVVIYLLFVLGIVLVARGLWQRRRWARTPFFVVQLFGLVIAYTLLSGDGNDIHVLGWIVGLVSVVGVVAVFLPRTSEALDQ
jgi:hypothetical protein